MVHYTEFGYEPGKCTQLAWNFGQLNFETINKIVKKTKKKVKSFTQLVINFESSWLQDELKSAVFGDDVLTFYRKYGATRNYSFLFFTNLRTFVCDFLARILAGDFERNNDGSIRQNCAIKKAQKIVKNNDINALLNMIDSHARLHAKGEQITFESLKHGYNEVWEDEETVEEELQRCTKSEIVKGLQKLHADGMCEYELRELCVSYGVEYHVIAPVKTYVQTTLDVA